MDISDLLDAQHPRSPVAVLLTGGETEGRLAVIQHTLPPFQAGPAPQDHPGQLAVCYVLEGVLALSLGDEALVLHQGELQLVRPGERHTYWNPTATATRLLLIVAPGGDLAELRRRAIGEGGPAGGPWDTS